MGTGTFVKERTSYSSHSPAGFLRGFDMPLLVSVVALVVFGLLMLYSASWDFSLGAYDDPMYMFTRQLTWLGLGVVVAIGLAFFDYHNWRKLVVPAMAFTVLLLMGVLLMNEIRFGAKRSFIADSVQPSELAKLISILYLAVWLYAKRTQLHDISFGLIPLGVILGVVGGLIYQQPDLSAAARCGLPSVSVHGTPGSICGPMRSDEMFNAWTTAPEVSPPATTSLRTPWPTSAWATRASVDSTRWPACSTPNSACADLTEAASLVA